MTIQTYLNDKMDHFWILALGKLPSKTGNMNVVVEKFEEAKQHENLWVTAGIPLNHAFMLFMFTHNKKLTRRLEGKREMWVIENYEYFMGMLRDVDNTTLAF